MPDNIEMIPARKEEEKNSEARHSSSTHTLMRRPSSLSLINARQNKVILRVVLLGTHSSLKSSLLNATEPGTRADITVTGIDHRTLDCPDLGGQSVILWLWDATVSNRFRNISGSYANRADIICFVADRSENDWKDKITNQLNEFQDVDCKKIVVFDQAEELDGDFYCCTDRNFITVLRTVAAEIIMSHRQAQEEVGKIVRDSSKCVIS